MNDPIIVEDRAALDALTDLGRPRAVQLAVLVWLEILLARSRFIPALSFVEQPPTYTETHAVQRFQASLSAFSTVWNYMALMALLFWFLFYAL